MHRIQNLRKSAGFEISDRIAVHWHGLDRLRELFAAHGDYIREETLANEVSEGPAPADAYTDEMKLDGQVVTLGVTKV